MRKPIFGLILLGVFATGIALWAVLWPIWVQSQLAEEADYFAPEGGYAGYLGLAPRAADDENAALLYPRVQAAYESLPGDVLNGLYHDSEPSLMRDAVAYATEEIALAHAAVASPGFHLDVGGVHALGFAAEVLQPSLDGTRSTAKLLHAEARVAALAADYDRAVHVLAAALATYDHLMTYPVPMSLLASSATETLILSQFEEVGVRAAAGSLDEFDLALARRDWMEDVRQSLLLDRLYFLSLQQPLVDPSQLLRYLRANRRAIESLDEPYHLNPIPDRWPELLQAGLSAQRQAALPRHLITIAATEQTRTNLVRSGIALQRHSLEHGDYPDDYEALTDLFTGEPLSYERTAAGFVLRSAGESLDGSPLEWSWESLPSKGP